MGYTSGAGRLAPEVSIAVLVMATAVGAQETPPVSQEWLVRNSWASVNGTDEARDIVFWKDPIESTRYVFVTGYLSLNSSGTNTVMVTYRYNADDPDDDPRVAYYPADPSGTSVTGIHKGVALTVHPSLGYIYVVGETAEGGNGQNYVTVKYGLLLTQASLPEGERWSNNGAGAGARLYDNSAVDDSNDIPTDIGLANGAAAVVVTGTSPGVSTGDDITTVGYVEDDGSYPSEWPAITGQSAGVRRYDGGIAGNDRAAEIGNANVACDGDSCVLDVIVVGTSDGDETGTDIVTIDWGDTNGVLRWVQRYNSPHDEDDVGVGVVVAANLSDVFVAGYSVHYEPPNNFGSGGSSSSLIPVHNDYVVLAYTDRFHPTNPGVPLWSDTSPYEDGARVIDWFGFDDVTCDIQHYDASSPSNNLLWVSGRVGRSAGTTGPFDFGTLNMAPGSGNTLCSQTFGVVTDSDEQAANIAPLGDYHLVDNNAYITGFSTLTSTGPRVFATVRADAYTSSSTCNRPWATFYSGGTGVAKAVCQGVPPSGSKQELFVAGRADGASAGQDFVVIRYKQN